MAFRSTYLFPYLPNKLARSHTYLNEANKVDKSSYFTLLSHMKRNNNPNGFSVGNGIEAIYYTFYLSIKTYPLLQALFQFRFNVEKKAFMWFTKKICECHVRLELRGYLYWLCSVCKKHTYTLPSSTFLLSALLLPVEEHEDQCIVLSTFFTFVFLCKETLGNTLPV